jgi:hypothetical protein
LSAELHKRVCGEFRCKICGGFIDGRDLAGFEDHETALPHPAQDQVQ